MLPPHGQQHKMASVGARAFYVGQDASVGVCAGQQLEFAHSAIRATALVEVLVWQRQRTWRGSIAGMDVFGEGVVSERGIASNVAGERSVRAKLLDDQRCVRKVW